MKMRPAVELSYLNPYYQQFVLDEIELNECTPSHAQTIRMRKLADEQLKEKIDETFNLQTELISLSDRDSFIDGFRLGLLIAARVFL